MPLIHLVARVSIALVKIVLVPSCTFLGVLELATSLSVKMITLWVRVAYLENVSNVFGAFRAELFQLLLRTCHPQHMSVILERAPLLRHVIYVGFPIPFPV